MGAAAAAAPAATGDAGEAAVVALIGASTSATPEPGNWFPWEEEEGGGGKCLDVLHPFLQQHFKLKRDFCGKK